MKHLIGNYYAVELPESTYEHHLYHEGTGLCFWDAITNHYEYIDLGSASYTITALSGEISEEVAKLIVDYNSIQEVNLDFKPIGEKEFTYWADMVACKTALDAFKTILTSRGIAGECVVLEKIK